MNRTDWVIGGLARATKFVALAAVLSANSAAEDVDDQQFRLQVSEDGVYRVSFEELSSAGLAGPVASADLKLENLGQAVAILVDDGNDGRFGPGDSLIFIGRHLRGPDRHFHDYSAFNVYRLSTHAPDASARIISAPGAQPEAGGDIVQALQRRIHLERDLLRLPLTGPTGHYKDETLWYWLQLNHLASEPTRIPIDLSHLQAGDESGLEFAIQFRGGSDSASKAALSVPDHTVDIAFNGEPIGQASWRGREPYRIELPAVPASLVREKDNAIELRVPIRRHGPDREAIVDVVYLDWIRAEFQRDTHLPGRQEELVLSGAGGDRRLHLIHPSDSNGEAAPPGVQLFAGDGFVASAAPIRATADDSSQIWRYELPLPALQQSVWVVPDEDFKRVRQIEADRPSNLTGDTTQRDYFIIAHGSLLEAVSPLAELHHRRGMRTELVDVQDIYDEFNHGIEHPRAIRDFLAHAVSQREPPAASHVLLVGDANWYINRNADPASDEPDARSGYIPTWNLRTRDGPAASDHPYVTLSGDSADPALAIGRFPASTASGVRSMVAKTIDYMERPPPGDWRSRVLLVSDREHNLSARNQQLSRRAEQSGLVAQELLPSPERSGAGQQQALKHHIDEGMLLLHFFGHGGRYMWQTAPSGNGDASNLFDMEDLDELAASDRLPIVLGMSCNTGPFDHPAADSLAEKFLRLEGRGAVAVLAASARNSPSLKFTNALFEGILGGSSLGEAIRLAKRQRQHPDAALLYNLFGDPALVPALP